MQFSWLAPDTLLAPERLAELVALTAELGGTPDGQEAARIAALIRGPATALLLAIDGSQVRGMLTLAVYSVPSGVKAWIEDVVVHPQARGQGVGKALIQQALQRAEEQGARQVDLTSRPHRVEANRLYQSLGFERRETNVYRYGFR